MDEAVVIDIDELLGCATPLVRREVEEYNFENLSDQEYQTVDTELPSAAITDEIGDENACLYLTNGEIPPTRKLSIESDFRRRLESSLLKVKVPPSINHSPVNGNSSGRDSPHTELEDGELLVDALVQSELSDSTPSDEEEVCIDVNSEELRRFIQEFEEDGGEKTVHDESKPPWVGRRESGDSLNSSVTTESCDGSQTSSLTSSFASSDLQSPPESMAGIKRKTHRGKSVRFLVSNLLRNNKARHNEGSPQDGRDKCSPPGQKQRSRRQGEDREKQAAMQQCNGASSPKSSPQSGSPRAPLAGNKGEQARGQTIATLLSPAVRDSDTLPRQLIQAAVRGDLQVLEFLLAANEGLSQVRNGRGNSLLHAVARRGHADCLAWLVAGPCRSLLTLENDDGFTAAALAVKHGHPECIKWLVCHSDARRELCSHGNQWSLLHLAARFGQEPCLRWMLEYMLTVDIPQDQTDHSRNSPAHLAAKYGHLHCLQTLVEFNSDVTSLNKKHRSPCALAMRYHHDTCYQFLVVVETCIKLTEELTVTQGQLRECQREKSSVVKKLNEALSCTDALVHMQKTDLSQRIDHIRSEYADLTSLLVRQLEHCQQAQAVGQQSISRGGVVACQDKAVQLEQACWELLELDKQRHQEEEKGEESSSARLHGIERRLSGLRPSSAGTGWPSATMTQPAPSVGLNAMRARLCEANQQISSLPPSGPSLASDNVDMLSLSSSSHTSSSPSSSTSSLQTGMVQTSPTKDHCALWSEPSQNRGEVVRNSEGLTPASRTSVNKAKRHVDELNPPNAHGRNQKGLPRPIKLDPRGLPNMQCSTVSRRDGRESNPGGRDIGVEAVVDPRGITSMIRSQVSADRKLLQGGIRGGTTKPPSNKPQLETTHHDDLPNRPLNGNNPAVRNTSHSSSIANPTKTSDPHVQRGYVTYPSPKANQLAMPDFMRKVQPTDERGQPESGKVVVVKITSGGEEMELPPPGRTTAAANGRLNSLSSVSSASSDLSESPQLNRPPRGGILSRKSTDSYRKTSQEKHIKFALDDDCDDDDCVDDDLEAGCTPAPAANPPLQGPSNRRDLWPIYEAPDLVRSTNDDSKSATTRAALPIGKPVGAGKVKERSSLKGKIQRLFSYSSSDEGERDVVVPQAADRSTQETKYPSGLSEMIRQDFGDVRDDGPCQEDQENRKKLWYECSSSDDDNDNNKDYSSRRHAMTSSPQSRFEKDVYYL